MKIVFIAPADLPVWTTRISRLAERRAARFARAPSAKLALRITHPEVSGSHRGVALWREEQESVSPRAQRQGRRVRTKHGGCGAVPRGAVPIPRRGTYRISMVCAVLVYTDKLWTNRC